MAHLDDGTLNALLDGELEAARAAEVRAHLASCAECGARFEEAKAFLAQSDELLESLVPPPAEAGAPAGPVGAPRAARPAASAEPPARRVPKTAREVAIDIDGSTTKSPAIPPNFPRPGDPVPPPFERPRDRWGQPLFEEKPARRAARRFDWPTLAWAASVVLALGVGYLANEVRQGKRAQALAGRSVADTAIPAAAERGAPAPTPAAADGRAHAQGAPTGGARGPAAPKAAAPSGAPPRTPAAPPPGLATRVKETRSLAANAPSGKSAAEALRAAGASTGNVVAAAPAAQTRAGAAPAPAAAAAPTAAAERLADAAPRAELAAQAPSGAPAGRATDAAAQRTAARAAPVAGGVAPPASGAFRAIDFDQAAAALGGTARWIEGLSLVGVKTGAGSLVPGADPTKDVVRVVYSDAQGRLVQLDQQRLASRRTAPAGLGLAWGDTLTAPAAGATRVRWLDRAGLWLSLSGNLPADSLRALLARVR